MKHCILQCRKNSIIGRYVQYCCKKYGINFENVISYNFSVNSINNMYFASLSDDTINTIHMVHELIMCRDGSFNLCNDSFDKTDTNLFIDCLSTS